MDTSTEKMNRLMQDISLIDNLKVSDIDEAINARKDILMTLPEGSDEYLDNLGMIGDLHVARFKQLPQSRIDLNEAIDLWREFCRICPHDPDRRLLALDKFSGLLQQRDCHPDNLMDGFIFQSAIFPTGKMASSIDLDEAIIMQREALKICPSDHKMHTSILVKLGSLLLAQTNDLLQLRESIRLLNSVNEHHNWTVKGIHRYILLNNLASGLTSLVGACARESVKNETEQLVKIHWELAEDYAGEMGPAISFWDETARWLQRLCEPPLRCLDQAPKLVEVADILLSLDSNNEATKRLVIMSKIAMEYYNGTAHKVVTTPSEPDHQSYLNHFKQFVNDENIATLDENINPIYNEYIADKNEMLLQVYKNLAYLCSKTQIKNRKDTYILAALNLASLFQFQQLQLIDSKFFDAALDYQLYVKQYINPNHEFYNSLQMSLNASLSKKYSMSNDLKDYELLTRAGFEMEIVRPSIGPSMLNNPWEATLEPYGHNVASEEETSLSLIEYASTKVSSTRTSESLYYLAERLLIHSNNFHHQDTKYLKEATLLVDEIETLNSKKLGGLVNYTSIGLSWFRYTGNLSYLDSALARQKTNRASYVKALHERFLYTSNMSDLEKAITLASKNSQHKQKSAFLGMCLNTRYYMTGNLQDLQASLTNAETDIDEAESYLYHYERFEHAEDLDKAFEIGSLGEKEELLETDEIYDDNRRDILYCKALLARYSMTLNDGFLATALSTIGNTVSHSLCVMLPHVLHCHASILLTIKNSESINHALDIQKKAITHLSKSHIYYSSFLGLLGKILCEKYNFTNKREDLISSIEALKEAVKYENVSLSMHQLNLGIALQLYSEKIDLGKSVVNALEFFRDSATSPSTPLKIQYKAAISWAKAAENVNHQEALYAYEYLMDVLPQLASLGLDIKDRHVTVANLTNGVAGDAAAYAIVHGFIEKAVEFLEHGRSIFWQQVLQLHSPMNELKQLKPLLADQLLNLARDLNISSFRTKVDNVSERYKDYLAREGQKRHDLANQWNELVKEAQYIPGCESLFQPPLYSKLASAASNSIIILLSTTTENAHAIIMKDNTTPPQALQLPEMNRVYAQRLAELLQLTLRGGSREARDAKLVERAGKLLTPFNMALEEKRMYTLLSELWNKIVKPVIKFLKLMPSTSPRITWCCTDILSVLPIHAAGLYQITVKISLSDFAISSYTPTLSNLIFNEALTLIGSPEMLLAGLEESPGYSPLPNVYAELNVVETTLKKLPGSTVINLKGDKATGNNVLAKLSSAHLVHLACHGAASQNPLESSLILYDGQLKIEKLIRTPLINAKLAFLSACQTAKINTKEPDESIHIAAAMLNTGFKSVIGTMWSIDDNDAPLVAKSFYEHLITEDGEINLAGSASALHKAIQKFKAGGISPLRWAPFIHMGF
ncbi:CHAT domain-containing protein [Cyathus striatus]|nr:CHAT domain-containing protein [Cyathus striatus]